MAIECMRRLKLARIRIGYEHDSDSGASGGFGGFRVERWFGDVSPAPIPRGRARVCAHTVEEPEELGGAALPGSHDDRAEPRSGGAGRDRAGAVRTGSA
jgi:hypothetical protein